MKDQTGIVAVFRDSRYPIHEVKGSRIGQSDIRVICLPLALVAVVVNGEVINEAVVTSNIYITIKPAG